MIERRNSNKAHGWYLSYINHLGVLSFPGRPPRQRQVEIRGSLSVGISGTSCLEREEKIEANIPCMVYSVSNLHSRPKKSILSLADKFATLISV